MLDDASYPVLWQISDTTGIRPEYLVPVLYSESGLRPEIKNNLGYSGLNQISQQWLVAHHIDPADYLTWPASRQLTEVVLPYMQAQMVWTRTNPKSGARVYEMNFYPAALRHADKTLDDIIVSAPAAAYTANKGLDVGNKGFINVRDMAAFVARAAASSAVKTALAKAYALRPTETMQDPALGIDFPGGSITPPRRPVPPAAATTASGIGKALVGGAIIIGIAYAASRYLIKNTARAAYER